MPLALTKEQEEQEKRIEQILKEHVQLVQLYGREVLKQRLEKLHINKMTFDTLFSDGCILVDINDWTVAFVGDKQAVANALRKTASKTVTEQEFKRYLNSVPASVRDQLRNLRDSAHNNTITIEKVWDVRNEADQLVPLKQEIEKSAIQNLIGGTEGQVTAEKIQDVQELVSDYLTTTADKIAGPVADLQPEAVQVADENSEAEESLYAAPRPVPAYQPTVEDDEEFLQDLKHNDHEVYNEVIGLTLIRFSSGQKADFELCLMIALVNYDNKLQKQQEKQALLLVQAISEEFSGNKTPSNRYGFFVPPQPQQRFFGVACRDENQQTQKSRTRDLAENFIPLPVPAV